MSVEFTPTADGVDSMTILERSAAHLHQQIVNHLGLFFPVAAAELLRSTRICYLPYGEAIALRGRVIAIPNDIEAPAKPERPYRVKFNGTLLTVWNPISLPKESGWSCLPDARAPLWYQHESGTLVPAYNLYSNLWSLLTLRDECNSSAKDRHQRFPAEADGRTEGGLLAVPCFNEAVAAIVAACAGLHKTGRPAFDLMEFPLRVSVVLSHDCDVLVGNDLITQAVRFVRVFQPIVRLKPPRLGNLWWISRNAVRPRDFYHDNITGMVDVERMFGARSVFYMLNGMRGRFGARSGSKPLCEALREIPDEWAVGMHYNYDTLLDSDKFTKQKHELERIANRQLHTGTAHYLRFDPARSWSFLADHGIQCDESVGYPNVIGYRCGIGGIFQPFDVKAGRPISLWEIPLVAMDQVLLARNSEAPAAVVERMIIHLGRIGGAFSVLFHPGMFFNPEFPECQGSYVKILKVLNDHNCRGESSVSLLERVLDQNSRN